MKIVVHTDHARDWQQALSQAFPEAQVVTSEASWQARAHADYLAVFNPPASLLAEQSALTAIINLGAGVDGLLNTPGLPPGVPIVKLQDAGMADLMADHVLYGVLHYQRHFDRYLNQQRRAHWQPHPLKAKADWTVGVLGLGAIGRGVAKRLAGAGFNVLGWSRSPKPLQGVFTYHGEAGLADVLRQSQTLVTLLPDTPATRQLINAERLALLPEGASLINTGRGSLIDHDALLDALGEDGHLSGAMLDVLPEEPLPGDSPLWHHPRVLLTPHVSAPTPLETAIDQVIQTLKAFEAGEPVPTVDPEAGY